MNKTASRKVLKVEGGRDSCCGFSNYLAGSKQTTCMDVLHESLCLFGPFSFISALLLIAFWSILTRGLATRQPLAPV